MSTRRSLVFSFLDRYSGLTINVVSSMVIARLLTPTEIGVFSVTMVLLSFVSTIRDMGAGHYLIQERELTSDRVRAVWAVQLSLGLGLACLVAVASYPVAVFYGEPQMSNIMQVVALNYAISPFGSLTHAWLMREMRFENSAIIRFAGALSGAVISIWMAWRNFGPMSLAVGSLASTLVGAIMATYFRPKHFPWMPGFAEVKRVLAFGSQLTASSILGTFSAGAPELLLGKLQNLTAVGFYSRSNGLVKMFHRLFIDAVYAVCSPWFAKHVRERGGVSVPFLKATSYITACGWSFCLVLICMAHPIIRIFYGTQWDQSVDLTRILAIATAFGVPSALCNLALLSSGAVSTSLKVTIVNTIQSVVFVAVGAWFGSMSMAIALVISAFISSNRWQRVTLKHIGVSWLELMQVFGKSALVAVLAGMVPALVLLIYGPYPVESLLPALLGGAGGLLGFVAGVLIVKHPLSEEIEALRSKLKEAIMNKSTGQR